jgi:hypothetical protein
VSFVAFIFMLLTFLSIQECDRSLYLHVLEKFCTFIDNWLAYILLNLFLDNVVFSLLSSMVACL